MLTDRQFDQMLFKLRRLDEQLSGMLFTKVDEAEFKAFKTNERLCGAPAAGRYKSCAPGTVFEGEGSFVWFKGEYRVGKATEGKELFIYPHIEGYEGLLFVDGKPYGSFSNKIRSGGHGNHYCDRITAGAKAGSVIKLDMEFYAHHYVAGTGPFDNGSEEFSIIYNGVDICVKNEDIWDVYFNLHIANQMALCVQDDFRRADVINTLKKVHETVYYDIENVPYDEFVAALARANVILKKMLAAKNPAIGPKAGVIGHSHMDTAWLWTKKETLKKCARTYANQVSLMDQYPEYTFMQSSAYHSAIIKENYPELFEELKAKVAEGRYEPNGGVWVECDCNIPTGETMVRTFVWGQRFTRENFGYTSDTFWLPDTFGYSAALPQIMLGSGIRYFLTTKIAWCDTTTFPYDTFIWEGLDGSRVLAHFNRTHVWPDPKNLTEALTSREEGIKEKNVTDSRLVAYGFGDGGGGPEFEMIEIADRLKDVNGVPKVIPTTVSAFMKNLEKTIVEPNTYTGELYLELHRGTLTNQHRIKRNNRLAEIALHNMEYLTVRDAVANGRTASDEKIRPLMRDMLVNQFHDILPGTCIGPAHDECFEEVENIIDRAGKSVLALAGTKGKKNSITVFNTTSVERHDPIYIDHAEGMIAENVKAQQVITDPDGNRKLVLLGVTVPAFGSRVITLVKGEPGARSAFRASAGRLDTPFYRVKFNDKGEITSLFDKEADREICRAGGSLNRFLLAEDVPKDYDNWNVDADIECRYSPSAVLVSREVVADGACEYRIRSEYRLTEKSSLRQDMIFYADSREIVFDTEMNWQDDHKMLKASFDTTVRSDTARCETQFGCIKRPTTRNTAAEKAKFEVSNHKYTDISEPGYGACVLNDCKYGVSVEGGRIALSLHKGGNRPDVRGDKGLHRAAYAFLPHSGGFGADTVIIPAYEFNYRPVIKTGAAEEGSLLSTDRSNIIIETVKPAEDNGRCFVIRVYEAEGTGTSARISLGFEAKSITETNLLEEPLKKYKAGNGISCRFGAFEIKTFLIEY